MDIEELKKLAQAANAGFGCLPWQITMARNEHGGTGYYVRGHCEPGIAVVKDQYWEDSYNPPVDDYGYLQPDERMDCDPVRVDIARYIAAANPATILGLIAEIERLRECLIKANASAEHFEREWYLATDELAQEKIDSGGVQPEEPRHARTNLGEQR